MEDEESYIQVFLVVGYVCIIMGILEYYLLVECFKVFVVIIGFEFVDFL